MDTIQFAKQYAKMGFQCFPLRPHDKTPVVKWADVATAEENMLVGWWENNPDANIGIACGKRSGCVVIDIDAAHGGYESLEILQEQYGKLPETLTAITGGGGEHLFFKHPGIEIRNSAGRLAPGIDIRGDGGYVVATPSVHPNGNPYKWANDLPLADMPQWMIDSLKDIPAQSVPVSSNGVIINGARNNTLTTLAGSMRRKGFGEDAIFAALKEHNTRHCVPPLSDGEVYVIARSIARYEPSDPPKVDETKSELPTAFDVIDALEDEIRKRQDDPKDVWGIHYAWPFLSTMTGGKQRGELIYLGGEPKVGKSWWAHQDAMMTAIGKPSENIPPVPALIWSGEMKARQVYRRMFEMMGVSKRRMLSGGMTPETWQTFNEAKATLVNSPLYVNDQALELKNLREFLRRYIGEYGIQYALFDYDWHIRATGKDETETSQNISREMKQLAHEFDISIMLISSVNKQGMDSASGGSLKSNLSGSGKKIHDADVIYILTKLNESNPPMEVVEAVKPDEYWRASVLHIAAARDLDYHLPSGSICYLRETPKPSFRELKDMKKKDVIPSWLERVDINGD